jgi:hypothetical protein
MFTVVLLTLAVILGLIVAVVAVVGRRQQRAITRDNQLIPGRPTRAPRSWARSHDPEAVLHRRLRDAMTALRGVNSFDPGVALVLRADLEQTALDLDNHLVAVALLTPAHKDELLQTITTTVEGIEAAIARYAAAATTPDMTALEADLATVQSQVITAGELQRRLSGGGPQ